MSSAATDPTPTSQGAQRRLSLSAVAEALAPSLDPAEVMQALARSVASELCDAATVALLDESGAVASIAEAGRTPALAGLARQLAEAGALVEGMPMAASPLLTTDFGAERSARLDPAVRALLQELAATSTLAVPLRARGKVLGVLTLLTVRGRTPPFRPADLPFVADLGALAGLVVRDALLYRAARAQREQQQMLSRASARLSASLDWETTLRTVIDLALPQLGDFGFFDVREGGEKAGVRRIARSPDPARQAILDQTRWVRSDRTDLNLCALSSGQPAVHPDTGAEWRRKVASHGGQYGTLRGLRFGSMLTVPLHARGQLVGALTLFFDVGGRRHGEAELQLAMEIAARAAAAVDNARLYKEAQDAARARDEFLSIASHELRTPLTGLALTVDSALRKAAQAELDVETAVARLEQARKQVRRLAGLVTRLLDVSRLQAGPLPLDLQRFDLATEAHEAARRLEPDRARAGSELRLLAPAAVHGEWDRERVQQMISNLLENAYKYGGGRPVELRVEQRGARAMVRVSDEGIGISEADQARIFERFERAAPVRHYGGFGLGLWIARQIAEAHGGGIRVQSAPGRGSSFEIDLPI